MLPARFSLQRQLVQAQKMEAVGTLAGGIAHDFNNLLQVVLGYSELLLATTSPKDRNYHDLLEIQRAGRSGADLVRGLLTLSRKVEPKTTLLDLNGQMRNAEKLLKRTLPKMIDIKLDLSDDLAEIQGDATQIDQVFMNLALNARDAMPDGGQLTVATRNIDIDEDYAAGHFGSKPGKYVLLSVSDTGCGMHRETVEHIFEPFFTTKETGKGTGLGLAMVYGIMQLHGGHVQCYSEPGKGTVFKLYFPAAASDSEAPEEVPAVKPRGGTETILLVDDEESIRSLGEKILRQAGYTVLTASDGIEAVEIYRAQGAEIAIVILDLIMPRMGGGQCLVELRKICNQVRVVVASGYSANGEIKEILAKGAGGFVGKPFQAGQLLAEVRRLLDQG